MVWVFIPIGQLLQTRAQKRPIFIKLVKLTNFAHLPTQVGGTDTNAFTYYACSAPAKVGELIGTPSMLLNLYHTPLIPPRSFILCIHNH